MMLSLVLCTLLNSGAIFDLKTYPINSWNDQVFVCKVDGNQTADVVTACGNHICAYSHEGTVLVAELPSDTLAFDVCDLDGDRREEVIAIQPPHVYRIPFTQQGAKSEPVLLFDEPELIRARSSSPARSVLAVALDGKMLLALPLESGVTLRTLTGAAANLVSQNDEPAVDLLFGPTFDAWSKSLPITSGQLDLGWHISQSRQLQPKVPKSLLEPEQEKPDWSALEQNMPAESSWRRCGRFALQPERLDTVYVDVAIDLIMQNTIVAIEAAGSKRNSLRDDKSHPPLRTYAGFPADQGIPISVSAPDCTGDGYADLVLWSAPKPTMSIESLVHAATSATWPVRVAVHPFSPSKNRFEPQAMGAISMQIPVTWFFSSSRYPLRNVVLRDFDGDQKADFACSTSDSTFSVWLAASGFAASPDETVKLPGPMHVIKAADLDGKGRCSVVFQGEKEACALFPVEK